MNFMNKKQYRINKTVKFELFEKEPFMVTPYSLFLAENLHQYLNLSSNHTVLDYGAGCGIQSIVASLHGAGHVYGVDIHQTALNLTQRNLELNHLNNVTTLNASHSNWLKDIDKQIDYIISNPASLPSPNQISATFWAGEKGNMMICSLVKLAEHVLSVSGNLVFIHTSLVCLKETITCLEASGFKYGIVAVKKLLFRDFYAPLMPYWKILKSKGQSYYYKDKEQLYELLYLIQAEKE